MNPARAAVAIVIGLVFACPLAASAGTAKHYRVLPVGGDDASPIRAMAVNERCVVAGSTADSAYTWDGAHLTVYPPVAISLLDGPYRSEALAINRSGVAVGEIGNGQPVVNSGLITETAVIFRDGKNVFIDDGITATFVASGIDNRGDMVGTEGYRGFYRRRDGTRIEIEPLSTRSEGNGTLATALDQEAHVVGGTTVDVPGDGDLPVHGFYLSFGGGRQHMRDLGALPDYPDTLATAINEEQTVVGYSGTASGPKWARVTGPSHAWVWQRGRMSDLGALADADSSYAWGINDGNVIVGESGNRAVRWVNKRIEDLNHLIDPYSGWVLLRAHAINRDGAIVGDGTYKGAPRAFLLLPI